MDVSWKNFLEGSENSTGYSIGNIKVDTTFSKKRQRRRSPNILDGITAFIAYQIFRTILCFVFRKPLRCLESPSIDNIDCTLLQYSCLFDESSVYVVSILWMRYIQATREYFHVLTVNNDVISGDGSIDGFKELIFLTLVRN